MKIVNHKLEGAGVDTSKQTPNYYQPPFNTSSGLPDAIIIHYTAMTTASGAVKVLTTKNPKGGNASAHLVIGKKGEVFQLADFNLRTWHAGESSYNGRKGYNSLSVGIEIDNAGWLEKKDGTFTRYKLGKEFVEKDVLNKRHVIPGYLMSIGRNIQMPNWIVFLKSANYCAMPMA